MAERKKKQQHHQDTEAVRPPSASVGETLRAARVAKKLEVDEVSHSIHIRPTQLKAIEDNNIEQLPGMTYAVGFVRSYANFLGLNGAEIVHRFKAEQGHSPAQSKLSFPEPIAESRVPDPMMVGVGAFLAVVILVVWTIYSNMHGSSKTATQIPPAPVVTSVADALPPAAVPAPEATPAIAAAPAPATTDQSAAAPVAPAANPPVAVATAAPAATTPDVKTEQPASPAVAVAPATAATDKPAAEKTAAAASAKADDEADASDDAEDTASAEDDAAAAKKKAKDSVIKIKAGKSRITLKASLASWVQVTDAKQNVLYRKVLRPGEQYAVPDQPGLVLDTANAGGLEIVVDGATVQPVGKTGEIVRDIALDPKALKVKRVLVRD